jgi:hypothetical protein
MVNKNNKKRRNKNGKESSSEWKMGLTEKKWQCYGMRSNFR